MAKQPQKENWEKKSDANLICCKRCLSEADPAKGWGAMCMLGSSCDCHKPQEKYWEKDLSIILDFVERWNKQDKEDKVADSATRIKLEIDTFLSTTRQATIQEAVEVLEGLKNVSSVEEHDRRRDKANKGGYELCIEEAIEKLAKMEKV